MAQDERIIAIDGVYGKSRERPDTFSKQTTVAAVHTYSVHKPRVIRVFFSILRIYLGDFFLFK